MKKLIFTFLLIITCHICFCQTEVEQIMHNPSLALNEAQKAFCLGDYKKAVNFLGIFQSLTGEMDTLGLSTKAKECYELSEKAKHFKEAGNYYEAIDILNKIKIINPSDTNISLNIDSILKLINYPMGRNTENGHEWVDLGLSVKWSTCNIGASSPGDYGDYFAWGETKPKRYYDWSTLKYCGDDSGNDFSKYSTLDNKTRLDLSDDAARVNWGGEWRMPTIIEFQELQEKCTWTWTTMFGHPGYIVTSKSNGNNIFIPAAGFQLYDEDYNSFSVSGHYWSSTLNAEVTCTAYSWDLSIVGVYTMSAIRCGGSSVRPVCP